MLIRLSLEAGLAPLAPPGADAYELPEGATVDDLLDRLGLHPAQVMLVFVAGALATGRTVIPDGAAVSLCPNICGG
jgi:sulfur carrier protein ThiS